MGKKLARRKLSLGLSHNCNIRHRFNSCCLTTAQGAMHGPVLLRGPVVPSCLKALRDHSQPACPFDLWFTRVGCVICFVSCDKGMRSRSILGFYTARLSLLIGSPS